MNALAEDYYRTFTTDPGRRVLEDLEREGFVTRPMLLAGAAQVDPYRLAAAAGQQNFVLRIKAMIETAKAPPREKIVAATGTPREG